MLAKVIMVIIKSTQMTMAQHSIVCKALSCPVALLQNDDDYSYLTEMETEVQRENLPKISQHIISIVSTRTQILGSRPRAFWPTFPVTSLFIPWESLLAISMGVGFGRGWGQGAATAP